MTTVSELKAQLEALKRTRASGRRRVQIGDREVEYMRDKELLAAIASLEYEIAALGGTAQPKNLTVISNKGW